MKEWEYLIDDKRVTWNSSFPDSKHPTPILAVWTISATFAPC